MHNQKYCHRDIKPENILFVNGPPGEGTGRLKICDFGTATKFDPKDPETMNGIYGSSNYVAPEMLKGKYNQKVDLWSIGVIMYVLINKK